MQQEQALKPQKTTDSKASGHENLRTILIAVALALLFRSCAYEPFHIPSGSMKSTLLVGDYIFVSKYSYGYSRYSFPLGINFFDGRIGGDRPKRGDIAVFRNPKAPSVDFIKRVVGLPGDRIQMKNGVLFINDVEVKKEYLDEFVDSEDPENPEKIKRYLETLPEGKQYNVLDQLYLAEADSTLTYVVPPKNYFMMGDNRDNSRDSRFQDEVGFVPEQNLVGRAEVIFISSDKQAKWYEVWKWPSTIRTNRFLKSLR